MTSDIQHTSNTYWQKESQIPLLFVKFKLKSDELLIVKIRIQLHMQILPVHGMQYHTMEC